MLTSILKTGKNHKSMVTMLFGYLLYRYDLKSFLKMVPDREEGVRIKDIARKNGYILKNCKLYAYAAYVARQTGGPKPKAASYGVEVEDAKILRKLNLDHLDINKYKAFDLKHFDYLVEQITGPNTEVMYSYTGKLISKKMTFLIKSYGVKRSDLESDLKQAALLSLYKQYPRYEDMLHFTNVAKAGIHNAAMTLLKHYTCQRRQRLKRNTDGTFESVLVDTAVLKELEAPDEYGFEFKDFLVSLVQLGPRLKPRPRAVLTCLCGQSHPAFSAFLNRDNREVAYEMEYSKYQALVQDFFKVNDSDLAKLFKFLRNNM